MYIYIYIYTHYIGLRRPVDARWRRSLSSRISVGTTCLTLFLQHTRVMQQAQLDGLRIDLLFELFYVATKVSALAALITSFIDLIMRMKAVQHIDMVEEREKFDGLVNQCCAGKGGEARRVSKSVGVALFRYTIFVLTVVVLKIPGSRFRSKTSQNRS